MSIELSEVKEALWPEIRKKVEDGAFPDETNYLIKFQNKSVKVNVQISKFNLLPDIPQVDLFIEDYQCDINGNKGGMTLLISIPNIENCEIIPTSITLPRVESKLWDNVDIEDIEKFVISSWNK